SLGSHCRALALSLYPSLSPNSPSTTETAPLPLHDALPIFPHDRPIRARQGPLEHASRPLVAAGSRELLVGARRQWFLGRQRSSRSEEHTSELQSRVELVCRLLLEKNKLIQILITRAKLGKY